ncbi:MAG: hypothetical protein NVS1B6_16760 [Steroidobacteraceae bacterium]
MHVEHHLRRALAIHVEKRLELRHLDMHGREVFVDQLDLVQRRTRNLRPRLLDDETVLLFVFVLVVGILRHRAIQGYVLNYIALQGLRLRRERLTMWAFSRDSTDAQRQLKVAGRAPRVTFRHPPWT